MVPVERLEREDLPLQVRWGRQEVILPLEPTFALQEEGAEENRELLPPSLWEEEEEDPCRRGLREQVPQRFQAVCLELLLRRALEGKGIKARLLRRERRNTVEEVEVAVAPHREQEAWVVLLIMAAQEEEQEEG